MTSTEALKKKVTSTEAPHKLTKKVTSPEALHSQTKRVIDIKARPTVTKRVTSTKARQKEILPNIDQKKVVAVVLRTNIVPQTRKSQKIEVVAPLKINQVVIMRKSIHLVKVSCKRKLNMRGVKIEVRRNLKINLVPRLIRVNRSRKTKYQRKKARKVIVKRMRKGLTVDRVNIVVFLYLYTLSSTVEKPLIIL